MSQESTEESRRGRPELITTDDMVRAIREANKPVTPSEIGEQIGVTGQAIRNRRDELEADPRVAYGQVGQATAYWLAENQQKTDGSKRVSDDDMVRAIRESKKPVLDAGMIADRVGVTSRTIRNRSEELKERDDVESMKIGRATVYWFVKDQSRTSTNSDKQV